jgi:CDP-glycerol glycerophosphotransferase (TagB/SpsB family)
MPIKKVDKYLKSIGTIDYFAAGSKYYTDYFNGIGIPTDKLKYFGLSRNDQLKEKSGNLQKIYDISKYRNVVMWMPTYRQHVSSSNACNIEHDQNNETGMPVLIQKEDFDYINNILEQNSILLIIKPHQSQNLDFMNVAKYTNIRVLTTSDLEGRNIQLYSILAETSALITDYSSIYIDYLLMNKPIAVTIDDYEEYGHKVGFVMKDFMGEIQGYKISKLEEFEHFLINIDNPEIMKYQGNALTRFHDVTDFKSSERIYQFVMQNIT